MKAIIKNRRSLVVFSLAVLLLAFGVFGISRNIQAILICGDQESCEPEPIDVCNNLLSQNGIVLSFDEEGRLLVNFSRNGVQALSSSLDNQLLINADVALTDTAPILRFISIAQDLIIRGPLGPAEGIPPPTPWRQYLLRDNFNSGRLNLIPQFGN